MKIWNSKKLFLFLRRQSIWSYIAGTANSAIQVVFTNYALLLEDCVRKNSLEDGARVHARMIVTGFNSNTYVLKRLSDIYLKCGKLEAASKLFDKMPDRDIYSTTRMIAGYAKAGYFDEALKLFEEMPERKVASWNALIVGYVRHGKFEEAVEVFGEMQHEGVMPDHITCSSVLSAYSHIGCLEYGKRIHAHCAKGGFGSDVFVGSSLIDLYAKCENVDDARQVFDKMPDPNVVSWNAMIAGYVRCGRVEEARQLFVNMPERDMVSWTTMIAGYAQAKHEGEALELFSEMRRAEVKVDGITLSSVVSSCADTGHGQQVHAYAMKTGFVSFVHVSNALITMYANGANKDFAFNVFDKMPTRDAFSWNAMIAGYARCESMDDAQQLFEVMPARSIVSWNAMIAGYIQHESIEISLKLFQKLRQTDLKPDRVTFTSVITACASLGALDYGKNVHAHIIQTGFESGTSIGNALVSMYAKCESIDDASKLFNNVHGRNTVSWNAIISAYAQHSCSDEAINLFYQMEHSGIRPDQFALTSVLGACSSIASLDQGMSIHSRIIRGGFDSYLSVGNALITMYSKCGSIESASQIFDRMSEKNIVSWNAIIAGCAQLGCSKMALKQYEQMRQNGIEPDQISFLSVLSACSHVGLVGEGQQKFLSMHHDYGITQRGAHYACMSDLLGALDCGKYVHAHIIQTGFEWCTSISNALVSMYAKCESIEDACKLFNSIHERNPVSWNAMISGYAQHSFSEEAINLFYQMEHSGIKPDQYVLASVLSACSSLVSLEHGMSLHSYIIRSGFESYLSVGNALITMYSKCGSIESAFQTFDGMFEKNIVSWNAMIAGCAQHGCGKMALEYFEQMRQNGIEPDQISFVSVLSACSHAGLVDEGQQMFHLMHHDYGITPRGSHYACMIDLLGRAGRLEEASEIIKTIPFEPEANVWGALLGACRMHGNIELGKHAAERLFQLEPQKSGKYVILANIYAATGSWDDVSNVRKMMKDGGVKKHPGCSWIEVKNRIHIFVVGDKSHPQSEEIYSTLERLTRQMKVAGYMPDTNFVLHDVEPEQKEHALYHHSEKLAIAFGLLSTFPGLPIRVIKNLRVCGDCHTAIKFISNIENREIIVRDAFRFHHFKDGSCSCGDYW